MERKQIRLRRDELLRIKFVKNEYFFILLKSLIKTRSLKPLLRFYAYTQIQKKTYFLSRWKNFCILSGRSKGTTKIFNISRQMLNKQSQQGLITGFRRNNVK